MILEKVEAALKSQLDQQAKLGVQIKPKDQVPEIGPAHRGLWYRIPDVTVVFVDLKRSTELNVKSRPTIAAHAYTYFVKAMAVIFDRFGSNYVDIQGDGVFGLFSGPQSEFCAVASAITAKTQIERDISVRFKAKTSSGWKLTAGVGIDRGTLLVRRLGLRNTKLNEVWAGKPVNMAAKLSSKAKSNQLVVSDRVFSQYNRRNVSHTRQRALMWSCGCRGNVLGGSLDTPKDRTKRVWTKALAPKGAGLDFEYVYTLKAKWCHRHGAESCETIVTGRKPKQATSGKSKQATSGKSKQATSGKSRQATSGKSRQATSGKSRQATSGKSRQATSGKSKQATGRKSKR